MGQKVNPTSIRLGISTKYSARWFREGREYADTLHSDIEIRRLLRSKLAPAGISRIDIDRPAESPKITIHAARPGVIIGKGGQDVEGLRQLVKKVTGVPAHIDIQEIRRPETNAYLVAENIGQQLEKRIAYRRAMKRAIANTMRQGVKGIKVMISGRLNGAEIARSEWAREGRVPLHTLRAHIDYATFEAHTTYGVIGIKVWIYKGEAGSENEQAAPAGKKQRAVQAEANK